MAQRASAQCPAQGTSAVQPLFPKIGDRAAEPLPTPFIAAMIEVGLTLGLGAVMANEFELRQRGRDRQGPDQAQSESGQIERPFDTSGMNWVPELDEDDPPYRDWWAVESERDDG